MSRFNLRVYGLIINDKRGVLVADEQRFGKSFTKFPGGGLEWGEGTAAGLQRELKEELGLESEIGRLFYVNEFYQESAFSNKDQLISFYYLVDKIDFDSIVVTKHEVPLTEEGEKFRWIPLLELNSTIFTFPIDKIVAEQLARTI